MITKNSTHKLALAITASILAAGGAQAYDVTLSTNLPPVTFHGFASQGFLASTKYNYLASDTKNGSFQFTEAGINASVNPFPRTRITAQGFLFDVGDVGNYQPFLDYASLEYSFNNYVGVRAGRIRKPFGIYNAVQDLDLARTSVLLPQGLYDARYRDLSASLDGGEFFGDFSLGKAGDLSYDAFGGVINIATDSGVAKNINNSLHGGQVTSFDTAPLGGGQLWWNTPVDGLRFGAAFEYIPGLDYNFNAPTGYPPPYPAMVSLRSTGTVIEQQYSAEYLWNNWTFQAEYQDTQSSSDISPGSTHSFARLHAWYVNADYRFNKWVQAGVYYTEDHVNSKPTGYPSDDHQDDLALSLRFDPTSWWIFKVEGHYIHGTALLEDNAANPTRNDDGWFMLALKTTVSF